MKKHRSDRPMEEKFLEPDHQDTPDNSNWQGVDKAPGEEKGKVEKVTKEDLKGKKVDADPEKEEDKPAH